MRKCNVTGEYMSAGFLIQDCTYVKYEKDVLALVKKAGYESLEEAYKDGYYYWTEWEDVDIDNLSEDFEICGGDGVTYELKKI